MNTATFILMGLATIAILSFLMMWTYFRMQRIGKKNEQKWHRVAFWWGLGITAILILATMISYFVS